MKTILALSLSVSLLASAASAARSVPVSVKEGETTFSGDLYLPEKAKGPLPLVLVIHEWWGKTEHPGERAKRIADELGYAALAVDLFGDKKIAQTPDEAMALAGPFYKDPAMAVSRLKLFAAAAPEAAKKSSASIDSSKVAAIGFCFGGTQALNLARAGGLSGDQKLLGVVSFHGGLASTLKAPAKLEPKVLVLHGEADPMVKPEEVKGFKSEMTAAKADLEFHGYPGATHAFTNPKATEIGKKFKMPIAYNEKADKGSWNEMKTFLKKLF